MKKTARNESTGDWLHSKPNNEMFEKNFDLIFRKKQPIPPEENRLKEAIERVKEYEYELNKSTGEVQKKED
jgi:hypothetical protein